MSHAARQQQSSALILRRGQPRDIEAVALLGIEALRANAYERLTIDEDRVRLAARLVVSGAGNYCGVAERDGRIVAAVSALIHDCLFYERKQASVVQFYTREPGAGAPLIREFLRWARGRPAIRMIVFTLEVRADPRIGTLLKRMGLSAECPVYMEVR